MATLEFSEVSKVYDQDVWGVREFNLNVAEASSSSSWDHPVAARQPRSEWLPASSASPAARFASMA